MIFRRAKRTLHPVQRFSAQRFLHVAQTFRVDRATAMEAGGIRTPPANGMVAGIFPPNACDMIIAFELLREFASKPGQKSSRSRHLIQPWRPTGGTT